MEAELTYRIILPVLLIAYVVHRGYYTQKHNVSEDNTLKKRERGLASRIAGLLGIVGLIATIIFIFSPDWLPWVLIPLPDTFRWAGVGITLMAFALLQWAQNSLGSNWSDTPRMMKSQALVTEGPYRWIRHPIYASVLLIFGATLLISANWLIGLSLIGMTALEIASRIRFEESLMIEYFGKEYSEYMKRTGRILPKFI